jgi:hypothetical protein
VPSLSVVYVCGTALVIVFTGPEAGTLTCWVTVAVGMVAAATVNARSGDLGRRAAHARRRPPDGDLEHEADRSCHAERRDPFGILTLPSTITQTSELPF